MKEGIVTACITVAVIMGLFMLCEEEPEPRPADNVTDNPELVWNPCDGQPMADQFRFLSIQVDSCENLQAGLSPLCPEKVKDYQFMCIRVGEREQCWTKEFFLKQMGCE